MHMTRSVATVSIALVLAGLTGWTSHLAAAPVPVKAEVRGWIGRAQFSRAAGAFQPVKKNTVLEAGDIIQTASGSAVDIFLGDLAGTVRLTESSTLVIEKSVLTDPAAGANFQVNLALKSGELLGRITPHGGASRFQVAVPAGIAAVVDGQFRIDSRGYFVLLEGKGVFVHAPATGEPTAHTLAAPPAVYFSPVEGVRTAPEPLVREVAGQTRSKLPSR